MCIERSEVTVENIPVMVLDALIDGAERCLRLHERGIWTDPDGSRKREAQRQLKRAREKRITWDAEIQDFGGKMEAIDELLQGRFVPPAGIESKDITLRPGVEPTEPAPDSDRPESKS